MKKITKLFFSFAFAFVLLSSVNAFAEGEVKLLRASSFTMSRYGFTSVNRSYTILVQNIAFEKKVSIWGEGKDGQWYELEAEFENSVGTDQEIWELHTNNGPANFVVKYEVNGEIYWDNNSNQNYKIESEGITLFNDIKILTWSNDLYSYNNQTTFSISAHLQNLGYDKSVKVVYTTNNWTTTQTADLNFQSYQMYGFGSTRSPNDAGFEFWTAYITFEGTENIDSIEYAISYEVNGEKYWDNNFGFNYVVTK